MCRGNRTANLKICSNKVRRGRLKPNSPHNGLKPNSPHNGLKPKSTDNGCGMLTTQQVETLLNDLQQEIIRHLNSGTGQRLNDFY